MEVISIIGLLAVCALIIGKKEVLDFLRAGTRTGASRGDQEHHEHDEHHSV